MQSLRSKSNSEKKRKKKKKALLLLPIVILIFLGCFLFYAFSGRFHVTDIIVSGVSFVKKDEAKAQVEGVLSRKLWGFIPQRSPMLIGKKVIEESLYKAHPPIKEVKITIRNKAVFVDIKERTATSVICNSDTSCFFLDDNGYAFAVAPKFEGSSFIKIQTFDASAAVGAEAVAKKELDEIIKEIKMFQEHAISIQQVTFTSEEDMNLITSNGTMFIIRRNEPAEKVRERFEALITSRPDVARGTYEYVDLRIDSKIFLKNRES